MKKFILLCALLFAGAQVGGCALLAAGTAGAIIVHEVDHDNYCQFHRDDPGCHMWFMAGKPNLAHLAHKHKH